MINWLSRNRNKKIKAGLIEIDTKDDVYSVAFLPDGKYVVSGGDERKVRYWKVEDGKENGIPMDAGSLIRSIAVSCDSKWIVSTTKNGQMVVWEVESNRKMMELSAHDGRSIHAVDISPDSTRIATGSDDHTACVWSLCTGERLLGPWQHENDVSALKFSPDGLLVATAAWLHSIRVYDSQNGSLLVDVVISVKSYLNESLFWSTNKHIFALSDDGNINCFNVFTRTTLSRWPIHSSSNPRCIAFATNGLFIAASDASSVSFWNTTTHQQIGPVVQYTSTIESLAISTSFDLAMAGGQRIVLLRLHDIIPSQYLTLASDLEEESLGTKGNVSSGFSNKLICASDTILELWRKDRLFEAIDVISREECNRKDQRHHMLATRAFLRARLRQWNLATMDAQKSLDMQPNALAYIALGMARFGRGKVKSGKEAFHWLLHKCNVDEMVSFIFLIKAIVMFNFGYHQEAIVRVAGLIVSCQDPEKASYCAVHTHMRLIEAKACNGRREYEKALDYLTGLQEPQSPNDSQVECISLMFGQLFDADTFKFMLCQERCEALYALGRRKEAAARLNVVWKDLERQSSSRKEVKEWLQQFRRRL